MSNVYQLSEALLEKFQVLAKKVGISEAMKHFTPTQHHMMAQQMIEEQTGGQPASSPDFGTATQIFTPDGYDGPKRA